MGWWPVGCVLSACSVARRLCQGIPGTRPRSALELSEQVVGYEPESTKEGTGPNSLRSCRALRDCGDATSWEPHLADGWATRGAPVP